MHNSVATKDHRGKAASDNREKKTGCDSVLHPEDPQSKIAPASQTSVMTKQGHIKLVSVPPNVTLERPKGADVFRRLSRLCENSARYNRTRNFEACGHAQSKALRAKKRKNSSSARCHDKNRFRFHTPWCMSRGDFTSSSGCPLMNQTSA